jgi:Holliday junction resolvase-like predicted endonuclease
VRDPATAEKLIAEFNALERLDGVTAQTRGQRFNGLIAETLRSWGIPAVPNLRSAGEIDVAFAVDDTRYILEAKWEQKKTDTGHLAKLQKRVRQRFAGTYGVFLSMSGYSDEALADLSHGERLEVLLLDREHLVALIYGDMSPQSLFHWLHDEAAFKGRAYTPLKDYPQTAEPVSTHETLMLKASESLQTPATSAKPGWVMNQPERQNPGGQYDTFVSRQGVYAFLVTLIALLVIVSFLVMPALGMLGRIMIGAIDLFLIVLSIGFSKMASSPVRLEIGVNGIQVFARSGASWLSWSEMQRVDVIRLGGNPTLVAWLQHPAAFPELDTFGGGPRYLPHLEAVAVCPLTVLRARRHEVYRSLQRHAGNRI